MELFSVLADPTRRQILDLLLEQPRHVSELVDILPYSQPNISKHLRVLREAELVVVRADAQRRWYDINAEPLADIYEWLATYRHLWEGRFDRLDDYLKVMQQQEQGDESE
jgi:DNA-binding transcriptional ArsR family regulator